MNKQIKEFVAYCLDFYGTGSELYDMKAAQVYVLEALVERLMSSKLNEAGRAYNTIPFEGDSFDREYIRDIMINNGLIWPTKGV